MKKIQLVALLFIALLMIQCRSSKKIAVKSSPLTFVKNLDELMDKISEHQEFKYYSAKGLVKYSGSDFSGTADAQVKLIKDSFAIFIIKKFGIELFRLKLDMDSVITLDRIQKTFNTSSVSRWTNSFSLPLDFILIQDVLTSGCYLTEYLSYELINKNNNYLIKGYSELFQMSTELYYQPIKPVQINISQNSAMAKVDFINHIIVDKKYYPSEINISYTDSLSHEEYKINLDWKEIKIDQKESMKFEIPNNYSRIP